MDLDFKITGADEIIMEFKKMNTKESVAIAAKAMRPAANIMRDEMRRRAPVRAGGKRNLKKSIQTKRIKAKMSAIFKVGAMSGRRAKYDGWYAHILESGARAHTVGSGDYLGRTGRYRRRSKQQGNQHPGFKARPFVRPAFNTTKHKVLQKFGRDLGSAILRHWKQ